MHRTTRALVTLASLLSCSGAFAAATDPDTTFAYAGRAQVFYDIGGGKAEVLRDVAVSPGSGGIYGAGSVDIAPGRTGAMLFKRTASGTSDTSFAGGWLRIDSVDSSGSAQFNAIAFDAGANGSVIAAGFRDEANGQRCAYAVVVLDNSVMKGVLDGGFGNGGQLVVCGSYGTGSSFGDVKVLPDGKFLVLWNLVTAGGENQAYLMRLLPNGQPDPQFNSASPGSVRIDVRVGRSETADRIAVTGSGYVVAGSSHFGSNDWDGYVRRYTTSGALDATYANAGTRIEAPDDPGTAFDDRVADLAIDGSGRAVLLMNSNGRTMRVVRLTAAGARDSSFSGTGSTETLFTDIYGTNVSEQVCVGAALGIDNADRIWISGSTLTRALPSRVVTDATLGVMRLPANGVVTGAGVDFAAGVEERGTTLTVLPSQRVLVGSRLRTTQMVTDDDAGLLKLLGTP